MSNRKVSVIPWGGTVYFLDLCAKLDMACAGGRVFVCARARTLCAYVCSRGCYADRCIYIIVLCIRISFGQESFSYVDVSCAQI